mmetsp:Transcript_7049/g.17211  ORF Transcript_7049/g.17211 Transcript_7049/m.17211 type:complete len:226 (-) Transcript_7049:752-1429(-)
MWLRHSQLIVSVRCYVPYPRQGLVTALFDDFQISHLNATHRKVRNFKIDTNGFLPRVFSLLLAVGIDVRSTDRGQSEMGSHQVFSPSVKLLNVPNDGVLVGQVGYVSNARLESGAVDVRWDGNDNFHVVGYASRLELGSRLDHVFDARSLVRFHDGFHPDQWFYVCVEAVGHEIEFAVGGNEGNGSVVFESRQPHTLVELDILQLDGLSFGLVRPPGCLKHEFVV